jgi:hypothetical protein
MITIELDNKKVTIDPTLKIWQYQHIHKENGVISGNTTQLLAMFLDMPETKLKNLPKNQIDFVLAYITNSMETANPDEFVPTFIHNGIEYGFENKWEKLAWGAWQDLEVLSSENITENIHSIMAVLYRPVIGSDKKGYVIEPYNSETVMVRAELFKDLPVNFWFGCANFFLLIARQYISGLENSLELTRKVNLLKMKGWNLLPKWVKKKVPLDTILTSHIKLAGKTLPNSSRWKP